jgi:hypothetical protein
MGSYYRFMMSQFDKIEPTMGDHIHVFNFDRRTCRFFLHRPFSNLE